MIFETHLTVKTNDIHKWIEECEEIGVKPLLIRLSRGRHADQTMCSVRVPGTYEMALYHSDGLIKVLNEMGYTVLRRKIESRLSAAGEYPNPAYYECHIKLPGKVDNPSYWESVGMALSYPVLAGHTWLTARVVGDTAPIDAVAFFNGKMNAIFGAKRLISQNEQPPAMHMETVWLDSNKSLDDGWVTL